MLEFSFNSQRDGILRGDSYEEVEVNDSFNSQRDGILLFPLYTCSPWCEMVSIPNGMEFYVM